VNVCGSPAWLTLRAHLQRSCGSEGWEFGVAQPWWGKKQGWRIGVPMACGAVDPQAYGVGLGMQRQLFF
jgi:hypothetical protein